MHSKNVEWVINEEKRKYYLIHFQKQCQTVVARREIPLPALTSSTSSAELLTLSGISFLTFKVKAAVSPPARLLVEDRI